MYESGRVENGEWGRREGKKEGSGVDGWGSEGGEGRVGRRLDWGSRGRDKGKIEGREGRRVGKKRKGNGGRGNGDEGGEES